MRKTFFDITVHEIHDIEYICLSDIPDTHADEFNGWFYGQTGIIVENCQEDGFAVYVWDFERWYRKKFHNTPTYFDW